jgi:hypothetical protein
MRNRQIDVSARKIRCTAAQDASRQEQNSLSIGLGRDGALRVKRKTHA